MRTPNHGRRVRVPVVLAAVALTTAAVAAACGNEVCREGDPTCAGGAGSTSSQTSTKSSSQSSTVMSSTGAEGGFIA